MRLLIADERSSSVCSSSLCHLYHYASADPTAVSSALKLPAPTANDQSPYKSAGNAHYQLEVCRMPRFIRGALRGRTSRNCDAGNTVSGLVVVTGIHHLISTQIRDRAQLVRVRALARRASSLQPAPRPWSSYRTSTMLRRRAGHMRMLLTAPRCPARSRRGCRGPYNPQYHHLGLGRL